jgi:hypothetical protein
MLLVFGNTSIKPCSLETMASNISKTISRIALHKRFTASAVEFLKLILVKLHQIYLASRLNLSILKRFSKVLICDASIWGLDDCLWEDFPGYWGVSSLSMCKLQLVYDFLSGQIKTFQIKAGTDSDHNYVPEFLKHISPGSLVLADLGYYSTKFFKEIVKQSAYFISRLKSDANIYDPETKKKIDFIKLSKKIKEDKFELNILIRENKTTRFLPCRLVAMKAPRKVIIKRRKDKIKSHGGRSVKKKTLELCSWTLMITNLSTKEMPASSIYLLYMIRWQIELIFKQFKSILQIHKCNSGNKYRVLCEVYGKLILATILTKICGKLNSELWDPKRQNELSFDKFFKQMSQRLSSIHFVALEQSVQEAFRFLERQIQVLVQTCLKCKQHTRATSLETLANAKNQIFIYISKTRLRLLLS